MGTGAPGWEVAGMRPEGREVAGIKPVGGTPGLGIIGMPPEDDEHGGGCSPDKLAAGIEGPGGGKVKGPLVDMGGGWNG